MDWVNDLETCVQEALFRAFRGLYTGLDADRESIERMYRMDMETIMAVILEMLFTEDEQLYKIVNAYHFKKSRRLDLGL